MIVFLTITVDFKGDKMDVEKTASAWNKKVLEITHNNTDEIIVFYQKKGKVLSFSLC